MTALDYALLVMGLLVIYLIFFRKKEKFENVDEKPSVPLLEEEPMTTFVRPVLANTSTVVEKSVIPVKKVETVEKVTKKPIAKKKSFVKSNNVKKRVYNEESARIPEETLRTPYRKEDTMNHIAPVLPIYENEPAVTLYEPSINISAPVETSPTVIETSTNDVSFNNNNDGFGGSGSGGEY